MKQKYKVKIDPQAMQDLKEIFTYVAINDSVDSANKLVDAIENSFLKLEELPNRGHIPEELRSTGIKKFLEIHYKPYRIIYEVSKEIVYVHLVLDGKRNIKDILNDRLFR
ncbi:MAG: type II toxin-antitoxin system RelE/ParE family toxin [Bacteroidetes bacterium]|nr:type II toxin-antitoxin system RelE/ParE family toxin [Bacteroidota bacterium]MBU2583831.1 type II toxin-antitoxin system RelE/ParE family toxin [Bacteroidota bacterium]